MRGKLVLTFLAGLVVGLMFVAPVGWQRQVQAQRQVEQARFLEEQARQQHVQVQRVEKPPQWEYKVVSFTPVDKAATNQMNQLAKERWEYVGLVSTSVVGGGFGVAHEALVAFRRPKQ
jgi:hypothetical protein